MAKAKSKVNQAGNYTKPTMRKRLSILDDAAISLEKSGYYKHFPEDTYQSLVIERRKLYNGY